jgi:methionyl-tRNA synthetase
MDAFAVGDALDEIWQLVRRLNRYVEEQAPWALAKAGSDAELDTALATLIEGVRVCAVLLHPYMPETMATLLDALGTPDLDWDAACGAPQPRPTHVEKLPPLFPKHQS